MKKQCILFGFAFLMGFSSCNQFLEVELPGQEPRLVLNAILEHTDTIKVSLTQSRGILEGEEYGNFDQIKDGEVFFRTENGEILPLVFIEKENPFESLSYYALTGYDFVSDEKYEIFAESPGLKPISSQTIFPKNIPIKEVTYVNLGASGVSDNYNLIEFTIKFEDPIGSNFYGLDGDIAGKSTIEENSFYYSELYPSPVNPIYEKDYLGEEFLFTDVILRGDESEMVFRTTLPKDYDLEVTINLLHVSESYYRYFESTALQSYTSGDFLAQPVLVFNNIKNGLGVFSARNRDQEILSITLED
jgi:hypothetical protein